MFSESYCKYVYVHDTSNIWCPYTSYFPVCFFSASVFIKLARIWNDGCAGVPLPGIATSHTRAAFLKLNRFENLKVISPHAIRKADWVMSLVFGKISWECVSQGLSQLLSVLQLDCSRLTRASENGRSRARREPAGSLPGRSAECRRERRGNAHLPVASTHQVPASGKATARHWVVSAYFQMLLCKGYLLKITFKNVSFSLLLCFFRLFQKVVLEV